MALGGRDLNHYQRRQQNYANPYRLPSEIESSTASILHSMSLSNNAAASSSIEDNITISSALNGANNAAIPSF